jgi:hypothetical protein
VRGGDADELLDGIDYRSLKVQPRRVEQLELCRKADAPIRAAQLFVQDQRAGAMLVGAVLQGFVTDKSLVAHEYGTRDLGGAAQQKWAVAAERAMRARARQLELHQLFHRIQISRGVVYSFKMVAPSGKRPLRTSTTKAKFSFCGERVRPIVSCSSVFDHWMGSNPIFTTWASISEMHSSRLQ